MTMAANPGGPSPRQRLATRALRTKDIYNNLEIPNPAFFADRAVAYQGLHYWDLAAADAYRAIDIVDMLDEANKERAYNGQYIYSLLDMYFILIESLLNLGCTKDALGLIRTAEQYVDCDEGSRRLEDLKCFLGRRCYWARKDTDPNFHDALLHGKWEEYARPEYLRERGLVRREIYPWNNHEPERTSVSTLRKLNEQLSKVAPKCEVRSVKLPKMRRSDDEEMPEDTSTQLGLFAKVDIAPGETLLQELSVLTATNRFYSDLCDACRGPLPSLENSDSQPTQCEECFDTVYCSENCRSIANETYHPAICGKEGLASIGTDNTNALESDDSLYLNLVARVVAMAETQNVHPLDLPEVMYLWGDFYPYPAAEQPPEPPSLPFSLKMNVVQPIRILEEMELDPYETLPKYDTWVINTLYAKFRAVASARQSTWDGLSEVSVVHPLWCLANHSCDPNVQWACEADIKYTAREKRVQWGGRSEKECRGGIKEGEQIFNHYCDIKLDVKERREWARAALGGACQCERCRYEEAHDGHGQ
jgi:hypothetical protein